MAADTRRTSGGISRTRCLRTAATPCLVVVPIQSAPIATAMPSACNCGPRPIRLPLRTLIRAACRSAGVSPGFR